MENNTVNRTYLEIPAWKRDTALFWAYFKIAALVVGGGYAILAAAQREFVTRRQWLTEDDVVEMVTITQTVPGIIACPPPMVNKPILKNTQKSIRNSIICPPPFLRFGL